MIISHMACFCRTGVKFEQCNINIFYLIALNKISDYHLKSNHQEMQLFVYLQRSNLCLKVLHIQKQPFKQLQYSEKKITLDKFSLTFRSSRSQIIFKIDVLLESALPVLESLIKNVAGLQPCNFIKETPTYMFSCEYCKVSRNSFLYRAPPFIYFQQLQR